MIKLLASCTPLLLTVFFVNAQNFDPSRIEILRDKWGVPHIYAPTDEEAAYGLAWAHAEDDFETIQLPLISAKAMLGHHLGRKGAPIDYVAQLLRLEETARQYQKTIDPQFRKLVNAYAAALNNFAKKYPKRVLVKKSFPITELDILKAYGLSLSVISGADRTIQKIFQGRVEPVASWSSTGSNAAAVSRKKTDDGNVYLWVNAHQPLEGPVAFYEAHVASDEGWNMLGGLFPGAPVVLHGTNKHLGWAHTVNYPDKVDVYQLQMNPDNPNQYMLDGQWNELEVRKARLRIKMLGIPITLKKKLLWSEFGPTIRKKKNVYAFSMSTLEDISAIEQWYYMNKAKSLEEFQEVLSDVSNPGFNIVYADAEDHIYHVGYGTIPFRKEGLDWRKTIPGNKSELRSGKYHPLQDLPQNLDPASGFVFNTNNSAFRSSSKGNNPDPAQYDETMGYDVWDNNRSIRLKQLMAEQETLTYERFKTIKRDLTLPDSVVFPIDLNALINGTHQTSNEKANQVKHLIEQWDRTADQNAIGSIHSTLVYERLNRKYRIPYKTYFKPSSADLDDALEYAYDYLMKHFGKLDVKLGEVQFLVRGERKVPLWGMSDVLAAIRSVPQKNGTRKVTHGEAYIMMIRYPTDGWPIIETINAYGASNQPDSPHYDDQMDLYVEQQFKTMSLDMDEVRKNALRSYHPE